MTARWWNAPTLRGELDAVLSLVNEARWQMPREEERAARKFCDALNRAWNARARLASDPRPESDWPLIKGLVTALPDEEALALLRSPVLEELVAVEPPILNHRELLRQGLLGSVDEIPPDIRDQASAAHRKLRRRITGLSAEPDRDEIQAALVRLADLVYVIRSNLQHGEKFASADPNRIARDRVIAERVGRMLELFFDLLLGKPSTSLVAYGALAPGGVYHDTLEGLGGAWDSVVVRGQLVEGGAFPRLAVDPTGDAVQALLLRGAPGLPERWARLDEIEGDSYRRALAAVETEDGELVIANVYAAC